MNTLLISYYLYSFFGSLAFTRGIFIVFLVHQGISLGKIGILQTILYLSGLVAEVPAGIFADRFKRKYSVAFGLVLVAISSLVVPFVHSFIVFSLLFTLQGIGGAFRSGADSALLFDGLKDKSDIEKQKYVTHSGKARSLSNIALGLAIVSGGFISERSWILVYSLYGACLLIAASFILSIRENTTHPVKSDDAPHESEQTIFHQLKQFFSEPKGFSLILFILGMGFIEASHTPFFIFGQILFKDLGMKASSIGIFVALAMGLTAIGYIYVDRLKRFSLQTNILWISLLTSGLSLIYLAKPIAIYAIFSYAMIDMLPSLLFVHTDNHIQQSVDSRIRASVLSTHALISSIFISLSFLGVGSLLDHFSAYTALGITGLMPLAGLLALKIYFKNESRLERAS